MSPWTKHWNRAVKLTEHTDGQIAFALKHAKGGASVHDVCREMRISYATFHSWRKRYGGLSPSEVRRMRRLEEENSRLKRLVEELSFSMLEDVLARTL